MVASTFVKAYFRSHIIHCCSPILFLLYFFLISLVVLFDHHKTTYMTNVVSTRTLAPIPFILSLNNIFYIELF